MDQLRRSLVWLAGLAAVGVLVAAPGCQRLSAASFSHTFPSKEAAAAAVFDALAVRDVGRLLSLAVTEDEFRQGVWPHLPGSQPEMGMPVDYVWSTTSLRSRAELSERLARFGGQPVRVLAVEFGRAPVNYGAFRIYGESTVTLLAPGARAERVRAFGSLVEAGGRWKVYSYIVD